MSVPEILMILSEFATVFEPKLQLWIKEKISSYGQYTHDAYPLEWIGYIEKLAGSGGKRIRPYLMFIMAQHNKGVQEELIWQVSLALELFHLFCLIHDDIIDAGEARRGVTTVHKYIAHRLKDENRVCDTDHIGIAQALLLGDLVLSWVYELMNNPTIPSAARKTFQTMVDEVLIGQMIDVEIMTRSQVNEALIIEKMYLKTASYTFIRPMLLGACLGECGEAVQKFCIDFGRNLGLAFQVQDDLLDLTVPSSISGKTSFADLRDRQHTFFSQHILEKGSLAQKELLCSLWGKTLTENDRSMIENLFISTGALDSGQAKMNQFFDQANSVLVQATLPEDVRMSLAWLSKYLRNRNA